MQSRRTDAVWQNNYKPFGAKIPEYAVLLVAILGCILFGMLLDVRCSAFPIRDIPFLSKFVDEITFRVLRNILASAKSNSFFILYFVYLFSFSYFSHAYINYTKPERFKNFDAVAYSVLFVAAGHIASYATSPENYAENSLFTAIIFLPSIYYCYVNYGKYLKLKDFRSNRLKKQTFNKSFENRVFFPVLLMIAGAIESGIYIFSVQKSGYGFFVRSYEMSSVFLMLSVLSALKIYCLYRFFSSNSNTSFIHLLVPIIVISASLMLYVSIGWTQGRYIFAVYCVTYTVGFFETVRHMNAIEKRGGRYQARARRIYFPGTNWGVIWISVTCITLPIFVNELGYRFIAAVNVIMIVLWLYLPISLRVGKYGTLFSVIGGFTSLSFYLLSCTNIGSLGLFEQFINNAGHDPNIMYGSVLALFSVTSLSIALIRFAKDITGLKLEALFSQISRRRLYETFIGPLMFTLICACALCSLCCALWFLAVVRSNNPDEINSYGMMLRVTTTGILSVFIAMTAFIGMFVYPGKLSRAIDEAIGLNSEFEAYAKMMKLKSERPLAPRPYLRLLPWRVERT